MASKKQGAKSNADVDDGRVPVTVLTGYLGSGKTTLLNYILKGSHGMKIAVIENEYGAVGVDDSLVKRKYDTEEEIFEMNNGCICCTVRGDLIRILGKLFRRKTPLDAVLIETTGLADPSPVAQTFFMDEEIKSRARLDGILTVVDAKHIIQHLDEEKGEGVENEAVEQIAFADKILLNKTDLVSPEVLKEVKRRIKGINPAPKVVETTFCQVALAEVMGIGGFNLKRVLEMEPDFLSGDDEHQHDTSITSVGFKEEGDLDMARTNAWLQKLLKERGVDIYRMKGVLAISGMKQKYVFQGVHMLLDGEPMEGVEWPEDEPRVNRLIFIGKNLDTKQLQTSFAACLVKRRDVVAQVGNPDKGEKKDIAATAVAQAQ